MYKTYHPKVGIIGGGLAGLSAAWRLRTYASDVDVVVLEKARRLGGRIETHRTFGADHGAHYFLHSEGHFWKLIHQLGLDDQVILAADQTQVFAIGRRCRAIGWRLHEVVARLFEDAPKTVRALRVVFRDVERASFGAETSGVSTFAQWLARKLGGDRRAHAFIRTILKGDLCAPHSHVSAEVGAVCLKSLLSNKETWYSLRGGLATLVSRLEKGIRRAGVRVITEWQAREVRPEGSRLRVAGAQRGQSLSFTFDAVIVASPLDGRLRVAGSFPRRCYHAYTSVLFRVPESADRLLRSALKAGGLYTDLPLNYVSSEGGRVYRVLVPDSKSLSLRSAHSAVAKCRRSLSRLVPGIERELRALRTGDWSVRHWTIGLPCSRPSRGVARASGIFWAGDWVADYPSMDGAVESGFEAAMQVHDFLSGKAP